MIGYIAGEVLEVSSDTVLLLVGDDRNKAIGYELNVSSQTAQKLMTGAQASFYVFTHLRADGRSESSLELYGFSSSWEKKVFLLLTSVSGVGFKTALSVLNTLAPETVLTAIIRQDRATLTAAPGIGKKTVERLILELSDKAQNLLLENPKHSNDMVVSRSTTKAKYLGQNMGLVWQEAQQALTSLGYREAEAAAALRQVASQTMDENLKLQDVVTLALRSLARLP